VILVLILNYYIAAGIDMRVKFDREAESATGFHESNKQKIDFFEIDRVIEDIAKSYAAPCATTWFKIMNNKRPSLQEYRAKVIEFMKEFENILSSRLPHRVESSICLEHVRNLLQAQILLVDTGKNKEVEKRFEYYTKHS
jgi:hypothetical protein